MNALTKKRRGNRTKGGLPYIEALLVMLYCRTDILKVEESDIDLVKELLQSYKKASTKPKKDRMDKSEKRQIKSKVIQIRKKYLPNGSKYYKEFLATKNELKRNLRNSPVRIYPNDKKEITKIKKKLSKQTSKKKTQADVFRHLLIKRDKYLELIKKLGKSGAYNLKMMDEQIPACHYISEENDDAVIRVFKSDHIIVVDLCKKYKNSKVKQADVVNHLLETRKCYFALRKDLKQYFK